MQKIPPVSPLTADAPTNSSTGGFPLQFTIAATIDTSDGAQLLYVDGSSWDLSGGVSQLGGSKPTAVSPPTFWRTFVPLCRNYFPLKNLITDTTLAVVFSP